MLNKAPVYLFIIFRPLHYWCQCLKAVNIQWDSNYLYYAVREPFPSRHSQTNLVFGKIKQQSPLQIESQMAANGVIFSDGIEQDFGILHNAYKVVDTLKGMNKINKN